MLDLDSVKAAYAGYFPSRSEIAMDVDIYFSETFDKDDFQAALESVFGDLSAAQSMFGADGDADVLQLLDNDNAVITIDFSLTLSTGFKIGDLVSFFTASSSNSTLGSLFLRIDQLSVTGKASASELNVELYSGSNNIGIVNGALSLSAGLHLPSPVELELTASGDMENELGLSTTLTRQIVFLPSGELHASFPFVTTLGGKNQSLTILFEDEDLFDDKTVHLSVDFNACEVDVLLEALLGKLGSIQLEPQSILGPMALSGIDFFGENSTTNILSSIDDLFPDIGQFIGGVLEGNSLLMQPLYYWGCFLF